MKFEIQLPQVGRKRAVFTGALSATATTLWIAAPAYLPFATVSAMHVVEGFTLPAAVGWVTLLLMERRIFTDLRRASEIAAAESPEHDRAGAR